MAESHPTIASLLSRKQIGFAFTLVVVTALLLGGAQFVRFFSGGQEAASFVARAEAVALAPSVAASTTAADADRIQTDLLSLRADPLVTAAAVYDSQGGLLAQYRRDATAEALPEKAFPEGQTTSVRETATSVGIWVGGQPVGALYVRRSFDWPGFLFPVLIGLAASLAVGVLLASSYASNLVPQLAKPLSAVANTALSRLNAELENATQTQAAEKAELASLRDALKEAQDQGAAVRRAVVEKEREIEALRKQQVEVKAQPTPVANSGKALIHLAGELNHLLPASPLREGAVALAETAAVLAAEPGAAGTAKGPLDVAALAAEAALAARLRAGAKKTTVAFDAFPGIPATIEADGPLLLRALSLVLNDAVERTSGGEIVFVTGVVKDILRLEIRDTGKAATTLPGEAEATVKRLGATLKGKATESGVVRWFDLALK